MAPLLHMAWSARSGLRLGGACDPVVVAHEEDDPHVRRRGFDSFVFLVCWRLWKERNGRTFDGAITQAGRLALAIQEEAKLWCVAGNRHLAALLAG
jgi:hypothetical protein